MYRFTSLTLVVLGLALAGCSSKGGKTADALKQLDAQTGKKVGVATKNDFVEDW